MFERKKKKTGIQTPELRKYTPPPMPPVRPPKPPTSGSNAVQPSPPCTYSTPCGWCAKWDKKCDKKIGRGNEKPQRGLRAKAGIFLDEAMDSELDDIRSGKGLSRLDITIDPNKPIPLGIRKVVRG